jgi:hypothetical protein
MRSHMARKGAPLNGGIVLPHIARKGIEANADKLRRTRWGSCAAHCAQSYTALGAERCHTVRAELDRTKEVRWRRRGKGMPPMKSQVRPHEGRPVSPPLARKVMPHKVGEMMPLMAHNFRPHLVSNFMPRMAYEVRPHRMGQARPRVARKVRLHNGCKVTPPRGRKIMPLGARKQKMKTPTAREVIPHKGAKLCRQLGAELGRAKCA